MATDLSTEERDFEAFMAERFGPQWREMARVAIAEVDALLTTAEAVARLGVSEPTLRRWAAQGRIGRKVGGQWRFRIAEVEALLGDVQQSKPGPETVANLKTVLAARILSATRRQDAEIAASEARHLAAVLPVDDGENELAHLARVTATTLALDEFLRAQENK